MIRFFLDYTVQVVILGTLILGIVSGALGAFAMLRKQALLGDAISHAALPGICVAFLLTLNKSGWILLAGAAISGWIGTIVMMVITDYTSLKKDAALGIILSVFFGFGLMLLTFIQRLPTANQAGLNKFLFGSASTLLMSDVRHMAILGAITLAVLVLFWKEFKLLTFDVDFAQVLGFPTKRIQVALTTLIVIAIVIGLQTVGVVLMSAMLIAPAAAARQWTDSLSKMVVLSSFFGAISGAAGSIISSLVYRLPTGPVIVLIMSLFVLLSLLFAPNRGILWELPLFKKFATAKSKNEPSERGETKYNSPEPKRKGIYFPEAGFIRDEPSEQGETKYNSPEPKRKGIYFPEAGFIRDEPSERGETI